VAAVVGNTDLKMQAEILTYSRSRGVFAGVALDAPLSGRITKATRRCMGQRTNEQSRGETKATEAGTELAADLTSIQRERIEASRLPARRPKF